MSVDAAGTFVGMRAVLPGMRAARSGAIVNVASTAGLLGVPGLAPYVASNHAVVGLTRPRPRRWPSWASGSTRSAPGRPRGG
jgi:NAD(P)-dependent dehydrogenase (short-subunit alcohol dehydrogenase family)